LTEEEVEKQFTDTIEYFAEYYPANADSLRNYAARKREEYKADKEDWDTIQEMIKPNASVEVLFGPNQEEDSEYWNDPENWDPHDYEWKCKVELLLYDWLKLSRAEHAKFREDHDISKGYMSLEWVLPSPMPEHTFNELPIIKEVD